jgi:hypothetical protein
LKEGRKEGRKEEEEEEEEQQQQQQQQQQQDEDDDDYEIPRVIDGCALTIAILKTYHKFFFGANFDAGISLRTSASVFNTICVRFVHSVLKRFR